VIGTSVYGARVAVIIRKLAPDAVKALIDTALFPSDRAQAAGLIDEVAAFEPFRDAVVRGAAWTHLELMRKLWKGRLVLKGVLDAEDARIARESGVDGVIVSNHGGRQLDGAAAPLRALPAVVAQAGGMTVMMDGGIRRGTDVIKALALGASAVLIGRPYLWGLAAGGAPGVTRVIEILRREFETAMALCGVTRLGDIDPGVLWRDPVAR